MERTNDRAIIEGDLTLMEQGACKMSYISKDASVVQGDYVETSGLAEYIPGAFGGRIREITPDLQELYYRAIVDTAVVFERIKEVLVIVDRTSD